MQHIVKLLAVAALVTTLLVITSIPAFARPLRGGVKLENKQVCEMLAENHPRFEWRPPGSTETCWHTSPGLKQASEVVPPV